MISFCFAIFGLFTCLKYCNKDLVCFLFNFCKASRVSTSLRHLDALDMTFMRVLLFAFILLICLKGIAVMMKKALHSVVLLHFIKKHVSEFLNFVRFLHICKC